MKRKLTGLAAGAAVVAAAGFLITWSGVVSVAASSGHWPMFNWFLDFAMRHSVRTHAGGIETPALDEPALILRGAGHYATGCEPCHGGADVPGAAVMRHMTPSAPLLAPLMARWAPNEIFWIVLHGLKYTGMPAWPAPERPDEVWAVVAFLLRLPELDAPAYRELVYGDASEMGIWTGIDRHGDSGGALGRALEECARCHEREGHGAGAFPALSGQSEAYLYESLRSYAAGRRHSGIMEPVAVGLSEQVMRGASAAYADRPATMRAASVDEGARRRGEVIARRGIPAQGVPACTHCHGPGAVAINPLFPSLAGQHADYLTTQLELWSAGRRGGTPYAPLMSLIAGRLEARQMRDVAAYFSTLPAAEEPLAD